MFGLIDPIKYGEHFYDVFSLNSRRIFQKDRKIHAKLKNKDKNYVAPILDVNFDRRIVNPLSPLLIKEQLLLCPAFPVAHIVLQPNASHFAIYSLIRSIVLEAETRRLLFYETRHRSNSTSYCCSLCVGTCATGGLVECPCHAVTLHTLSTTKAAAAAAAVAGDGNNAICVNLLNERRSIRDALNSDGDSELEECSEKDVKSKVVPHIVGAGLRSLFELISEARHIQPMLCSKALKALLDVIQGQEPESFKQEPADLINVLYDLLLDLTTMSPTNPTEADWSSMACSALMGLCISRGDTGQMLKALATMLMAPRQLTSQQMQMPTVLHMLQRTVTSAALAKPISTDFYNDKGVQYNSLVDEFCVNVSLAGPSKSALASDGTYLYLLVGGGLFKIGTGYNNSYKGHLYSQNLEFTKEKVGWLGYSGGQLYYRRKSKRNNDHIHLVNTETLIITSMSPLNMLPRRDGNSYTLFTDGTSLNVIYPNRDDTLMVKQLNILSQQQYDDRDILTPNDLPLQLSCKRFRTLGYAAFEEEILNHNQILNIQSSYNNFEPKITNKEIQDILCGQEFGLVCTTDGKVYYYGKSAALGLKSIGCTPVMKLTELIISKTSRVASISLGHDGIHALLVNEDGSVYIVGTARRGEDGDLTKNRRQPKAVKPKKLCKIEGHCIVQSACNNGTSAFVTKTGKLIMYGKDTTHCDAQGFVNDFNDQHIQKVALGKAHCVAVNVKGQVYTFGLNNKGQCGHVFLKGRGATHIETKTLGLIEKLKLDFSNFCDYDDHNIIQGQCRICVLCKECTGYNVSCVALNLPLESRVSGASCACGHGDAGCSKCGLCVSCIAVQEGDPVSDTKDSNKQINRQRSKGLLVRRKDKKLCDDININSEGNSPRVAPLPPQLLHLPSSSPIVQVACGLHHTVLLTMAGEVFTFGSNQFGQLGTGDLQPVVGPVRVNVAGRACPVPICQIAAGSNHTVLLTYKGLVYTFGNYQKGQLGRLPHDTQNNHNGTVNGEREHERNGGSISELMENCSKVTESSSVAELLAQRQKILWHCTPGVVFGIGPSFGKKAVWIGASGDQTFIKIDESLITTQMLTKINVTANRKTILMIPAVACNFQLITINRYDGSCTAHTHNQVNFSKIENILNKTKNVPEINQNIEENMMPLSSGSIPAINEQMSHSMHEARNQLFDLHNNQRWNNASSSQRDHRKERRRDLGKAIATESTDAASDSLHEKSLSKLSFAMDPLYDVLWVYDGNNKKMLCYNALASEINLTNPVNSHYKILLAPELSLPRKLDCRVSRLQASLNLLTCLDILTSAKHVIPACFEDITPKQESQNKEIKNNQYQTVNRFDNFGGGWGYSGHSIEAIRFSVDTDVIIYGFGMFGGRGEYSCKIKLYDLGVEGGDYEKDGSLMSETQEVPFECPAGSVYHILLPKPTNVIAGRWYLVLARIAGSSSDCGSCGQSTVTTEDQVTFTFKSSKIANNGTDVNSGQIPSILYHLVTLDSKQPIIMMDVDPVKRVTNEFANTVTKECFESLVLLLNWSWESFKGYLREQRDMSDQLQVKQSLQYLKHVNKCCLRLLRKYTNEIYPKCGLTSEDTDDEYLNNTHSKLSAMKNNKTEKFYKSGNIKNYNVISGVDHNNLSNRKPNMENIQLAECIGNVRAMLIGILCDDIFQDMWNEEMHSMAMDIMEECHTSFVNCFGVFYPTSILKWNCLCESLSEIDKQGSLYSYLLSAILAGLCSPTVKLRSTFALFSNSGGERQSIISPSDNSGLPILSLADSHQYPILVEQMIYRTQQEKIDFLNNSWTFKDVLMRLLNIIANPIRDKIECVYYRHSQHNYSSGSYAVNKGFYQGLIDNCCNLLARVLAEIVYQMALGDYDKMGAPPRTLHSTGCRFSRCDQRRTWSTGNFGPDAIAFTVDRCGIAIAGAMVYSGSGSYEYQLDLLFDNTNSGVIQSPQHQQQNKWETLESISGTYDQSAVHNRMAEIKFERSVLIKENTRYALRMCSQGARTCSGDGGMPYIRGPCGTIFHFYACDLSFNGTNAQRGQLPCILYYSTPLNQDNNYLPGTAGLKGLNSATDNNNGVSANEHTLREAALQTMRDTALQIATDINKKCSELLILARNTLAASLSPSDISSNHSPTMDSEHNITPIEEHMDINWANNSRTSALSSEDRASGISAARDLTKRLETFSKGIIETLKFEKRSTNPFEIEIEIGSTDIHSKDIIMEGGSSIQELNQITKFNGNERVAAEAVECYTSNSQYNMMGGRTIGDSDDTPAQLAVAQILEIFSLRSSNLFHTLLPLVYAHIANLACSDAKSSVHILGLIKDILPHVASLNQLHMTKESNDADHPKSSSVQLLRHLSELQTKQMHKSEDGVKNVKCTHNEICTGNEFPTTSKHYCIVESEHPYRGASVHCYRVEFPSCVQWLTIEFDGQCGTAQLEDCLLVSIPTKPLMINNEPCQVSDDFYDSMDNNVTSNKTNCRNSVLLKSCYQLPDCSHPTSKASNPDWIVIKKFNTPSKWLQNVIILPGNCVEFTLETASHYAQDPHVNRYGFKCLVVGYDNPTLLNANNTCLMRIEQELAYLGGMCSANLMKKNLSLPDDKDVEDLSTISETISLHFPLLTKGLALTEPELTIHQALESYLPIGSKSIERQFLKDFISGAPGSSGGRLAAWLQPEPRLDPNKCELNPITEPLRCGWPTQITINIRDQYGDAIVVPDLKVEVKATPTGILNNDNINHPRVAQTENVYGDIGPPPRLHYESTIKENMCFKAITFMKCYHNYSFEELRYNNPVQTRVTETLYAQDMEDGNFCVHWTPNVIGTYCLTVMIDSVLLEEVHRVVVKEGNMPPPSHRKVAKTSHTSNKLRKFYTDSTAGLRIRSHPTLQSEEVGIVKLNGIILFIDEIENDDGVWVRLSTESIRQHCTQGWYPTEAWCLQYNQHFDKILLHPVVESLGTPSTIYDNNNTDPDQLESPIKIALAETDVKDKHREINENVEAATTESSPVGQQESKSDSPKKNALEFPSDSYSKSIDDQSTVSTNPFLYNESAADKTFTVSQFQAVMGSKIGERPLRAEDTLTSSIAGSTNAIGTAIAGVVGGGAIKLQALQKWFKGDSLNDTNYGRESQPLKRNDVGVASVSVRELVRAMGGHDSTNNGNNYPHQRRSSSPLPIPLDRSTDSSSSSRKSSEATTNSGIISSTVTQGSSKSDQQNDISHFDITDMRKTNFTPSQAAALLSTPKHSPRRVVGGRRIVFHEGSTISPEKGLNKTSDFINLGNEVDLMEITTTTAPSQKPFDEVHTICSTASTDRSSPPIWPESIACTSADAKAPTLQQNSLLQTPLSNQSNQKTSIGPIKRGLPPSFAESTRAVFAAFIWHEGIVHDAMACASFLKFHPNLPKEGTMVITRRDHNNVGQHLSREEKAQQRHSVEVATAGNYLSIRPSTLETLTKSGNFTVHNRKYRKAQSNDEKSGSENAEKAKLQALTEIVTVLPPALRSLVYLWENISKNCIQMVQYNSINQENCGPFREHSDESIKGYRLSGKEGKKTKKKKDEGYWCEICQIFLPIPVTYHMRMNHPGCSKPAKGRGYNSVGIYCEGWAGNCGEGGKGAASWFIMCDSCREKYFSTIKISNNLNDTNIAEQCNELNLFGLKNTSANSEIYTNMRENATFLLELSSNSLTLPSETSLHTGPLVTSTTKRSPQQMPVVVERPHFNISDINKPSTSRRESTRYNRIGLKINGKIGSSSYRKTSCSPEQPWLPPENFACLETFGTYNQEEMPYEMFGLGPNDNCIDKPLSDISYELPDTVNNGMKNSKTSKFHRSFSMGQGWGVVQQQKQLTNSDGRQEDNYYSKVILQGRNNSSTENEGSLLICYPSENLKRLVPDHMLMATSAVHQCNVGDLSHYSKDEDKLHGTERSNLELGTPNREDALMQRPSLKFMTQKHDLTKLRSAMKRSLRIATCRNYSLQALNWLLRSVTQNVCLHDLMWWFVSSLSASAPTTSDLFDDKYDDSELALEHPVSYTQISGRLSHLITDSLHKFLQSVADLTLYLPLGSPLQQIAIQCFGIRFRQSDHQFLHRSHVFGNISKILSKSDEQNECSNILLQNDLTSPNGTCDHEQNVLGANLEITSKVVYYSDLNGHFEITVSSRQRMVEALIDNSTETFWESDEEDRNKSKVIEIAMSRLDYCCKMLLVHIDNSRDVQSKVSNVTFYGGQSLGDATLIKSIDVDSKCCSWITVKINDDNFTQFRLEFSGPENTLRVRQIKLLGLPMSMCQIDDYKHNSYDFLNNSNAISTQSLKSNLKLANTMRIQHQICESETLRVFRLITSQVFGKLILMEVGNEEGTLMSKNSSENVLDMDLSVNSMLADSLDLREHMVGILFSRSKLSHLQKQVIVHIVYAIKKEARRAHEDWDAANLSDNLKGRNTTIPNSLENKSETSSNRNHFADTYCFEMLSMVLALSGSVVGRSYLSHQHGLIKDILTLLHAGSDRVQRQVTALLRRILPEISPATFGEILGVHQLPHTDYNIAHQIGVDFDMDNLGLLDILLAVIAKALQLQVKVKNFASKSAAEKSMPSLFRMTNVLDLSIHLLKPIKRDTSLEKVNPTIDETFTYDDYAFVEYGHFGGNVKQTRPMSQDHSKGPQKNLNQRWFLKGIMPSKQADSIISLIKDLAAGKLGDKWAQTTKAAIAEAILNLTRLDDVFRTPDNCIKTATLWLALASLCVLNSEHVEKLSSGRWALSDSRPMCSNHDDGETAAMIQCESCGSLCGDCDRFLHLNRKTRTHKRTVCKEEEEAIRVELHESCGRVKLFWLLALADSRTLKSIVEFRDGNHAIISSSQESVGRCRFCGVIGNSGLLEIGNVCADAQCQEYAAMACMKSKPCGHPCGGVVNEQKCLPCLHHVCHAREVTEGPKLTQDADDMCMICFVEALACAPSIQLHCGHIFHYHCCKAVLEKRWNGPRITFGFSLCPICKADIDHSMLADILEPINLLKEDVKRKALIRIKYEGLVPDRDDRDLTSLAMDRYAYYVCFKCQKAYFGGEARCDAEIGEHFNPQELVCGGCSDVARAQMCPKHGTDFLEYKCRYCCSVAVYFCFGTTHFCNACHDGFQNVTNIPKSKLPQCPAGPKGEQLIGDECPLHVMHPPTGEEFALGCGICRKAQTF